MSGTHRTAAEQQKLADAHRKKLNKELDKKTLTKTVDVGFIHTLDSQRLTEIAALLLATDNHFNSGTLTTSLMRAVMFSVNTAHRLVIEVDPFMLASPPEKTVFNYGKPLEATTPEAVKACERMFMAATSYLASGGQIITPDTYKGCWGTVYPEFLTTTRHGTSKKDDKAFAQDLQREKEIQEEIEQKKFELDGREMAMRSLKDPELIAKATSELNTARTAFLEEIKKLKIELADVESRQQTILSKRGEFIETARDSLDLFSFFTYAEERKWKVKDDPLYNTGDHQLTVYGLLGAALDNSQIAFTLYYHGEAAYDLEKFPTEPLEFFNYWQSLRKRTIDTIASGKVPFDKIPRKTTTVHFWFSASLLNEFILKIAANRAVFMQNRIADRHHAIQNEAASRSANTSVSTPLPAEANPKELESVFVAVDPHGDSPSQSVIVSTVVDASHKTPLDPVIESESSDQEVAQ